MGIVMKRVLRWCGSLACIVLLSCGLHAQKSEAKKFKQKRQTLTGIWKADDQGTYQIRQEGPNVWWYGRGPAGGSDWQNVFCGALSGTQLEGEWADLPPGGAQSSGRIQLQVNFQQLVKQSETGGLGGSQWSFAPDATVGGGGTSVGDLGSELNSIDTRSRLPKSFKVGGPGGDDKADSVVQLPGNVVAWFEASANNLEGVMRRLAGDDAVNRYLEWEQNQHPSSALDKVDLRLKAISKIVR
jgi:hypothetical protein